MYVPPNPAAANNMRSRLKKKLAAGKAIPDDMRAWLDANPGGGTRWGPAPSTARAEGAPVYQAPPPVEAYQAPPAPPTTSGEPMTVVDFGAPQAAPEALALPKICQIPGCQHTPKEHGAQRCGITGEKYYPPLRPNSRKAAANVGFAVIGFFIALAKGLDEAPDPTPGEVEDLSDAIGDIVSRRAPELGAYDDLLAGGYAISAYSIRAAAAPRVKR